MMKIRLLSLLLVLFVSCFNYALRAESGIQCTSNNRLIAPEAILYKWYYNGELMYGVEAREIVAAATGEYHVEVTDSNGNRTQLSYTFGANAAKTTVFVIGDSTASDYGADRYPRTGWGQVLQPFFTSENIAVSNHAASGRSSKSFYDEGRWQTVYNALSAGDYVFIQFAHNDEKTEADRHTDPQTTYKDYLNIFISGAEEKGAYPVLLSSIPRNNWSGSTMRQSHADYTTAMKEVAVSNNLPYIDIEASLRAYLNSKGKSYATDSVFLNLSSGVWPNYPGGNSDGTHLQEKGAFELCQLILSKLKSVEGYSEVDNLVASAQTAIRVSAMPDPALKGRITGTGVFPAYTEITLNAVPLGEYIFSKWTMAYDTATYSLDQKNTIQTDTSSIDLLARFKTVTGMAGAASGLSFNAYPNPVKDQLYFSGDEPIQRLEIVDIFGKRVKSIELSGGEKAIETGDLPDGHYLVKAITQNRDVLIRRFVKQ